MTSRVAPSHASPSMPRPVAPLFCDLCGERMGAHEFSQAVRDTSGMDICSTCLEAMIDAPASEPRSEVGLARGRA